ncbi:branched-chain amino acid ABC transporter permease [Enterococcus hirae]|nr:branched-chain amino acid ABC transporter permease [Enterococcus hirae]
MKKNLKVNLMWLGIAVIGYLIIYFLHVAGLVTVFSETTMVMIGINVILATGLNLIIGFAGQFSLGHAGFMAIGAYGTSLVLMNNPTMGGLFTGLFISMILSGLVALVVGIPTLRLKGDYLAIATLGISEIIRIVIINMPKLTNGPAGLFGIPNMASWSLVYILMVLSTVLIYNFIHSGPGRAVMSVREDEIAAEAMGVNTTKYKVMAFVFGAMTAAIAGGLHASYIQTIAPKDFTFNKSIDILIIVVFGGIGSLTGTFVASIALGILNMVLQDFGQLRMIIYALALIIIMIFKPNGLLGNWEFSLARLMNRKKKGGVKDGSAAN